MTEAEEAFARFESKWAVMGLDAVEREKKREKE